MTSNSTSDRREATRAAFLKLLGHLGRKEFDAFEACLAPDMVQVWPYRPLPSMAEKMVGARTVREFIETGMSDFLPYNYTVHALHDLVDPEALIAEYSSASFYLPRQVPYANRYISVLKFRDGLLAQWSEYVNPLIIKEALLDDFDKSPQERTGRG